MGTSSDPYDGLTRCLATVGSIIVFGLGMFCFIYTIILQSNDDFKMTSNLIKADEDWSGKDALAYTLDGAIWGLLIIGVFAIIAACVGCTSAQVEWQAGVCTFMLFAAALALCFLFTFLSALSFSTTLVPIADRQSEQFCNVDDFYTFRAQLSCTFSAVRPGGECGVFCQDRVKFLQASGGCGLLAHMCHHFDYKEVGAGLCSVNGLRPPVWNAATTINLCQDVCSDHVSCSGYSYNEGDGTCYIISPMKPTILTVSFSASAAPNTTEAASPITGSDKTSGTCWKKDQPSIVSKAADAASTIALMSIFATILAAVSTCCTCSLLFTLSTRRKGKKGAMPVLYKLLCPCCQQEARRKFQEPDFPLSDEEGSE